MAKAKAKGKKKGRQAKLSKRKGKSKASKSKARKGAKKKARPKKRKAVRKVSSPQPAMAYDTSPEITPSAPEAAEEQLLAAESPGPEETSYSEIDETGSAGSSSM